MLRPASPSMPYARLTDRSPQDVERWALKGEQETPTHGRVGQRLPVMADSEQLQRLRLSHE